MEDIIWGHLEKPFPIEIAREANMPNGWVYLVRKMMERAPDDRFQNYREVRDALENVHSFRYDTREIEEPMPQRPISVPRSGNNTQTLHGLMAESKQQWDPKEAKIGTAIHLTRQQVEESLQSRPEPLQVEQLVNTIRDLCHPRPEDPKALAEVMDKVPGYESAVRLLVGFMVGENEEGVSAERMDAAEALETLGLERARNLAITFFALN